MDDSTIDRSYYYQRTRPTPTFDVSIASTNEPKLAENLAAWRYQTFTDWHANVAIDCIENETWTTLQSILGSNHFDFTVSPHLRGLYNVWNATLQTTRSPYIVLAGADVEVPRSLLANAKQILEHHPEYGWLIPSVRNLPDDIAMWCYIITKPCLDKVGPFDPAFGLGGLGMVRDWQTRAYDAGYPGATMAHTKIGRGTYSIMDKLTNIEAIEGGNTFQDRYHIPIVNTTHIPLRPHPIPVNNEGEPITQKEPTRDISYNTTKDTLIDELNKITDTLYLNRIGPRELDRLSVQGLAAIAVIIEFWKQNQNLATNPAEMDEELHTASISLNRLIHIIVKTRLSGLLQREPSE